MKEDQDRWNKRYQQSDHSDTPSRLVTDFVSLAPRGRALDIATGRGRNALFLAQRGFDVTAVDISDKALENIKGRFPNLHPVRADLDTFDIPPTSYSLIVNIRFLSRRLFPQIIGGLKTGGILIFEGLLEGPGGSEKTSHPEYRLQTNELLQRFLELRIVYYRETMGDGETDRPLAALVGIKP